MKRKRRKKINEDKGGLNQIKTTQPDKMSREKSVKIEEERYTDTIKKRKRRTQK